MPLAVPSDWDIGFIVAVSILGFIGRTLVVGLLAGGLNCGGESVGAPGHLGVRSQLVLAVAGLRGGTAFALAMKWDGDNERVGPIEMLTMGVILMTLCGVGSVAGLIIGALGLQKGPKDAAVGASCSVATLNVAPLAIVCDLL